MEKFFENMRLLIGEEFSEFIKTRNEPPFRGLRVNTLKCSRETVERNLPFELESIPFCCDGYYIPSDFEGIGSHPLHHAGAFYVQEPSAMSAVTMLAPKKGELVLDLCAAPGGKSSQIAAALQGEGLLWANEIVTSRANILLSNLERLGVRNAVISSCRPQTLCEKLGGVFDKILVDAPCSGEGMFRKDKNAVREWSEENVTACAERQLKILESAKLALKSGGAIVYSTCTFSYEENEGVISRFLERNPEFELEDSKESFGRNTMKYAKRIFPMDGGEGHFAAKLRHKGEPSQEGAAGSAQFKKAGSDAERMYENVFPSTPFGDALAVVGTKILALPEYIPPLDGLNILRAGVHLGDVCKNRIEPAHAAFMAARPQDCACSVNFSCDDGRLLRFLRGEEIEVSEALRGYTAVCADGVTVGFGKASNGTLKNKYPKGLRVKS